MSVLSWASDALWVFAVMGPDPVARPVGWLAVTLDGPAGWVLAAVFQVAVTIAVPVSVFLICCRVRLAWRRHRALALARSRDLPRVSRRKARQVVAEATRALQEASS